MDTNATIRSRAKDLCEKASGRNDIWDDFDKRFIRSLTKQLGWRPEEWAPSEKQMAYIERLARGKRNG